MQNIERSETIPSILYFFCKILIVSNIYFLKSFWCLNCILHPTEACKYLLLEVSGLGKFRPEPDARPRPQAWAQTGSVLYGHFSGRVFILGFMPAHGRAGIVKSSARSPLPPTLGDIIKFVCSTAFIVNQSFITRIARKYWSVQISF